MKAKANRDASLIGRRLYSHTSLVRTIEWERLQAMRLHVFGRLNLREKEAAWERAAYASEDQFLSRFNGRVG